MYMYIYICVYVYVYIYIYTYICGCVCYINVGMYEKHAPVAIGANEKQSWCLQDTLNQTRGTAEGARDFSAWRLKKDLLTIWK